MNKAMKKARLLASENYQLYLKGMVSSEHFEENIRRYYADIPEGTSDIVFWTQLL